MTVIQMLLLLRNLMIELVHEALETLLLRREIDFLSIVVSKGELVWIEGYGACTVKFIVPTTSRWLAVCFCIHGILSCILVVILLPIKVMMAICSSFMLSKHWQW